MYQRLLNFDKSWLQSWNDFASKNKFWQDIFKFCSEYLIYSVPIILLVLWFYDFKNTKNKIVALSALLSAGMAALISNLVGRFINRPRPFEMPNIKEIIFHRPSYSFPSDHAAVLFAITFALFFAGYKKIGYLMLAVSLAVVVSRIATGIHYPSDIVAGAVVGLFSAWLVWLLERPLTYIYNIIIGVAKKVRLA